MANMDMIITSDDVIMFKVLKLPTAEDFQNALNMAQEWAESVGYTENDVDEVIKSVRKKNKQ